MAASSSTLVRQTICSKDFVKLSALYLTISLVCKLGNWAFAFGSEKLDRVYFCRKLSNFLHINISKISVKSSYFVDYSHLVWFPHMHKESKCTTIDARFMRGFVRGNMNLS